MHVRACVCARKVFVKESFFVASTKLQKKISNPLMCTTFFFCLGYRFAAAGGFPSAQYRLASKVTEVALSVEDGAREVDIVVPKDKVYDGDWKGTVPWSAPLLGLIHSMCQAR